MTLCFFRLLLSSLLLSAGPLLAQAPSTPAPATPAPGPTPDPKEKKSKLAYIRFWNMLPKEAGNFNIMKPSATGGEMDSLIVAPPANTYASYITIPAGHYPLQVIRASDPKNILKTFDLTLKANVFVTFIARAVDRQLTIEMVDDTYDRVSDLDGRLTIRQEVPGATISVVAGQRAVRGLAYGQVEKLEGFVTKTAEIKMNAVMANGQKKEWVTEIDFASCRHATVLLALDPYGRFRPRVSPDGQRAYNDPDPNPNP